MNRSMKQMLSTLLVVAMMAAMLVVPSAAADKTVVTVGDATYTMTVDTAAVTVKEGEAAEKAVALTYTVAGDTKVYDVTDDTYAITADAADATVATAAVADGKVTITGVKAGTTTVTVKVAKLDLAATIDVTVEAAFTAPTTGIFTMDAGEIFTATENNAAWRSATNNGNESRFNITQDATLPVADFFTVYAKTNASGSSAGYMETDNKTYDDGYNATCSICFGDKIKFMGDDLTPNAVIGFTTGAKATVKVWWRGGGTGGRTVAIAVPDATATTEHADYKTVRANVLMTGTPCDDANVLHVDTFELAEAGTYYVGNVVNNNRIYKIEVNIGDTPVPVALTGKYTFDATKIAVTAANTAVTNDLVKAATTVVTTDATPVDAMFTVDGTVTTKWETDPVAFAGAVELAKKEQGKIIFTIPEGNTATVTVGACSTNTSNESAYAMKKDGEVVANDGELVSVVAGNTATMIVYTDLGAGTYEIVSPEDADRSRGMRIVSVEVDFGGAAEPGPGPSQTPASVDTTALTAAIAAAKDVYKTAGDTYVIKADTVTASNVDKGTKFVLKKDVKALADAIEAAEAVAANTEATQADVDAAVATLKAAVEAYNKAIKTGTKSTNSNPSGNRGSNSNRPTETVTTGEDGTTAKKATDGRGNTVITVTDKDGEVIAQVTLPATVPSVGYKFVDVPDGHWAADAINDLAGLGMVKGVNEEEHVYDMNSAVTRGSVATILYRLSQGKEGIAADFADVADGAWYADAVGWAAKYGVVTGKGDSTFAADEAITREQLAVMLYRYAKLLGMDVKTTGNLDSFVDATGVSTWAQEAMVWAVGAGIVKGTDGKELNATDAASRAETACMVDRFIALAK